MSHGACSPIKENKDHQHPSVSRDEIHQQSHGSLGQSKLKCDKERQWRKIKDVSRERIITNQHDVLYMSLKRKLNKATRSQIYISPSGSNKKKKKKEAKKVTKNN